MSGREQAEHQAALNQLTAYVAEHSIDVALAASDPRNQDLQGGQR